MGFWDVAKHVAKRRWKISWFCTRGRKWENVIERIILWTVAKETRRGSSAHQLLD